MEAKAAEALSVKELSVITSGEGVSAGCGFSGYESDNYIFELYLNRVDEEDIVFPVAGKTVAPTGDGSGFDSTDEEKVEPGIYKATAMWQRMDDVSVVGFQDSPLYEVSKEGDIYIVRLYQNAAQGAEPVPGSEGQATVRLPEAGTWEEEYLPDAQPFCNHEIFYSIVQPADADHDALMAGQCYYCGEVLSYSDVPNSAYEAFLKEAMEAVRKTQEGEVVVSTNRWMSFNWEVLDAIMEYSHLAVTVYYRYEGGQYKVTIPPGADVSGLAGEDGFCGFRYLDQVFGGEEVAR